jgi:hypothetical protein
MVQIWKSKTLWVNVLAAISLFASAQFGYHLSAEMTGIALAGINGILRAVTNEPLEW